MIKRELPNWLDDAKDLSDNRAKQDWLKFKIKAIECHKKHLKIVKDIDKQNEEGRVYGYLGIAYMSQGDYQKAIEYVEKRLKIAKDIGDRVKEGKGYGNLGNAYDSLSDYHKAIE